MGSGNLGTSCQAGLELTAANKSGTKGSVSQSVQIAWHIAAAQPLPATDRVDVVLLMGFFFSFVVCLFPALPTLCSSHVGSRLAPLLGPTE